MDTPSIIDALAKAVPAAQVEAVPSADMETLVVGRESLVDVCRYLRDDAAFQFSFLADIIGVDLLPDEPRFEVVYHLACLGPAFVAAGAASAASPRRLRLKVRVPDGVSVPTVTSVWPAAGWAEREVFDMVGISFEDHPDLRRILMTDDWDGHPLRKDYPVQIRKSGHIPWAIELTPEQFARNVQASRAQADKAAHTDDEGGR